MKAAPHPGRDFDPNELAELHLLEAAIGGQSILDYIPRVSPIMPGGVVGVAPAHLKPIADLIALAEYQPMRVCISVPPRHGKTELLLHAIAWWLARHPEHTVAYTSYSADIAGGKSIRARDLAQASDIRLRADQARASEWRTMSGGGLLATGVGGPLTGQGANLLIVDDPIKNREEAESTTQRQKVWEWFTSTAMTRVTPGGSVIVVHTRWHGDDLIGRLKKKGGWTIINLPTVNDDGTYLWPEGGWDQDTMVKRREEVGEYDWWSLFMGEPRPRGGRLFEEPCYYDKPNVLGSAKILISCDPAATAKTHADYSVICVGAIWTGEDGLPCIDVLDVQRMQCEIPMLVRTLAWEQRKWKAPVVVEAVGGFKAVPQTLRSMLKGVRIIEVQPTLDKFTRALPASAAWNAGRIRLPDPGPNGETKKPWLDVFLDETANFTGVGDVHDDQVDALAHLYHAAITMLAPRGGMSASEASRYLPFG
jgi:predicted phage terminase large subunit-like protein